ncbi:helix-turn-helix domain-containing protein [Ensifer sesbaniae]|uniref:Crp/Fnr family transcriptional regulator n=1 Tax=Ensifer sesbaniae TaxID=1214071 RepID=UPI00156921E5|nr:cyclic nucleotide-binding domain-containing protein [Ensifer sesbaniae]MCK3780951.1 helix-turn-helix domain-containing protein [Ensifer sesbaniae]NRQ12855.1 Nitrogen fixation regulation protein FixK [Ensifer sesbaniae]
MSLQLITGQSTNFAVEKPTLSSLFRRQPIERLAPGFAVFWEGDEARNIFEVVEGMLRVYRILNDGRRVILGFVRPGDLLGVSLKGHYLYTVEAITPVELRRLPKHHFESLSEREPHLKEQLFSKLCDEMAAAQDQMVLFSRRSAEEKLAGFLLLMARGHVRNRRMLIDLPMTRLDIADYLGMTIETVSRTITKLSGCGVIATVERRAIALMNMDALIALAGGELEDSSFRQAYDRRHAMA